MKTFLILLILLSEAAFGQSSSSAQKLGAGLAPVGAIMAFGMDSCPTGWIAADGVAKSTATYAALDAVFATTWGARSGGNFKIPNLNGEGRYLRGGTAGTLQAQQTAKNGLSATSETIPTESNHTHTFASNKGYLRTVSSGGNYVRSAGTNMLEDAAAGTTGAGSSHGHSAPTITVTSSETETRPISAVIKYCIKY
jgi:microcystin-dependent protein